MAEPSETPPPRAAFDPESNPFETPPPRAPSRPGGYLPRLRAPGDEEAPPPPETKGTVKPRRDDSTKKSESSPAPSRKARAKAKADGKSLETPSLETYEGRRAVRIAVGFVAAGLVALFGYFLYRAAGGGGEDVYEVVEDPSLGPSLTAPNAAKLELEARQMFQQARLAATTGNTEGAVSLLEKLVKTYASTASAKDAQAALARPPRGLPLFVDGDAVVAEEAKPPPAPEPAPAPPIVEANPPPSDPTPGQGEVALTMPATPAEPRQPEGSTLASTGEQPSKPLPKGFRPRPEAGVHASGWPLEIVGDRDGATMVLVPGGTFTMGRDDGPSDEAPAHQVTLSTYYIDQHEVTVRQFDRFRLESDPTEVEPRSSSEPTPAEDDPDRPVVRVTAREAVYYARWAAKSLPTEAQWEMAARTPDGRITPWGPGPPPWTQAREPKQIDRVMAVPGDLSPYGAYDLAGNAWEWTSDWYDSTYYRQFRNATASDPTGPSTSRSRPPQLTIKGGSSDRLSSWREPTKVDTRLPYLGFRCALSVDRPIDSGPAPAGGGQAAPRRGVVPF